VRLLILIDLITCQLNTYKKMPSYILGAFLSWRAQALICSVIPVIIFFLMIFVPESPFYLAKKGKFLEGEKALMKYRGATSRIQVQTEYNEASSNFNLS
jgi:MFS family permease